MTRAAVGHSFMIALGKDVSESALRRKKAAKAKKQKEQKNKQEQAKRELYSHIQLPPTEQPIIEMNVDKTES